MQPPYKRPVDDFDRRIEPRGNGWAIVGPSGKVFCSGSPRQCEDWLDAWENLRPAKTHTSRPFELIKGVANDIWIATSKCFAPRAGLSKAARPLSPRGGPMDLA